MGEVDRSRAIALLIGPLVLGRLSTLPDFDYRECAHAAVDGFLHVQRAHGSSTGQCLTAITEGRALPDWAQTAGLTSPLAGRPGAVFWRQIH